MSDSFTGSSLAYIFNDSVLVYKRDNNHTIPSPGLWDFPGGGREGDESPEECVLRELKEEFSLSLPASRLNYKRKVKNHKNTGDAYFFVAFGKIKEIDAVQFGDEGQYWKMMPIKDFLCHPQSVNFLVDRLQTYLDNLID